MIASRSLLITSITVRTSAPIGLSGAGGGPPHPLWPVSPPPAVCSRCHPQQNLSVLAPMIGGERPGAQPPKGGSDDHRVKGR